MHKEKATAVTNKGERQKNPCVLLSCGMNLMTSPVENENGSGRSTRKTQGPRELQLWLCIQTRWLKIPQNIWHTDY